ncbi:MAG: glycerate kinase [Deltaproteobacteria bacterium]|nr:glycerate kinase [Deltaproteobacteria bacterium]
MSFNVRKDHLSKIFNAALKRVDPYQMLMDHVKLLGSVFSVQLGSDRYEIDLNEYHKVVVVGAGKATAPMAKAIEEILGDRLSGGLVSVKYGHTEPLAKIEIIEAGHPVPDENGVRAATRILKLAESSNESTLIISLISGGGSALLPLPARWNVMGEDVALTLADKQETTALLLACGADIEEINCIRKHLSSIKGGRFLSKAAPARSINFILSDVVGDDLSSIASGTTCADPTTFIDALDILKIYGIDKKVPESVRTILTRGINGDIPETLKSGNSDLDLTTNILLGTNLHALDAAAREARELGYQVICLTSRIVGEAREVAKTLAAITIDCAANNTIGRPPICIMSGGEPVVQLRGSGKGGRNQEMALAFLLEMIRNRNLCKSLTFLAASTDGNDGPTDAAGAFADQAIIQTAAMAGLDPNTFLENNDSYHFFQACSGLFKTGPTNTNVCDLHISLIDKVKDN